MVSRDRLGVQHLSFSFSSPPGGGANNGATTEAIGKRQMEKEDTNRAIQVKITLGVLYRNTSPTRTVPHPEYWMSKDTILVRR
jgi:hypothetical protein